jgi:hypothetical protein
MQDIGMSPDYRSGISDTVQCQICYRHIYGARIETCAYCGRNVCPQCSTDYRSGAACRDCEEAG